MIPITTPLLDSNGSQLEDECCLPLVRNFNEWILDEIEDYGSIDTLDFIIKEFIGTYQGDTPNESESYPDIRSFMSNVYSLDLAHPFDPSREGETMNSIRREIENNLINFTRDGQETAFRKTLQRYQKKCDDVIKYSKSILASLNCDQLRKKAYRLKYGGEGKPDSDSIYYDIPAEELPVSFVTFDGHQNIQGIETLADFVGSVDTLLWNATHFSSVLKGAFQIVG